MSKNLLGFSLLLGAALLTGGCRCVTSGSKTNAFFAFCIDTHDAKKRNLEQQAALLKELGYDGWITSDTSPVRQDPIEVFAFNVRFTNRLWE